MAFFGTSCAVDSLGPLNNPLGDNSNKFCELCGSDTLGIRCTNRDPYAEYSGALKCLQVISIKLSIRILISNIRCLIFEYIRVTLFRLPLDKLYLWLKKNGIKLRVGF